MVNLSGDMIEVGLICCLIVLKATAYFIEVDINKNIRPDYANNAINVVVVEHS